MDCNDSALRVTVKNHWRFAEELENPGVTEFVTPTSAELQRGVFDPAGKAIYNHRIALAVDYVFNFSDHTGEPGRRKPTFEDRELYSLAVLLADFGDALEPRRAPSAFRAGNVVCDKNVHRFKAIRTGGMLADHRAGGERGVLPGLMVAPNGRSLDLEVDDGF